MSPGTINTKLTHKVYKIEEENLRRRLGRICLFGTRLDDDLHRKRRAVGRGRLYERRIQSFCYLPRHFDGI
jgi:hypothetical protein